MMRKIYGLVTLTVIVFSAGIPVILAIKSRLINEVVIAGFDLFLINTHLFFGLLSLTLSVFLLAFSSSSKKYGLLVSVVSVFAAFATFLNSQSW